MLENKMEQTIAQDELHEECGVFGIYDLDGELRYRSQRDTGTER